MNQNLENLDLSKVPLLFETDDLGIRFKDKIVHLHFYMNGTHWYAVEHDGENIFYGMVISENNFKNAGWREFCIKDIQLLSDNSAEIAVDHDWMPVKAGDVDLIRDASNWD